MKRQGSQKQLALLLVLALVIGLLPVTALAADTADITVFMTVSDQGSLATDKNDALVARVPVTLTGAASYTIDDALRVLHENVYTGGAAAGYASSVGVYGLAIDKLWGNESGAFGYYVNDAMAFGLTDPVSDGDAVTAFIYKNTDYSDRYAWFDKTAAAVTTGSPVTLTLSGQYWNAGVVTEPVLGATLYIDGTATGVATGASGQAVLSFSTAGTYILSAQCDDPVITAAACKVTVADPAAPHVTVRIEGNGHGTDGPTTGIGTVLEHTVVNLSDLDETPTAYEAICRALEMRGLEKAVLSASRAPISFAGVSADTGYDWNFNYNDAGAMAGIYTQSIHKEDGARDSIVMYLTGDFDSGNYCKDPYYAFFAQKSMSFHDYGYPYAQVGLTLKQIIPADWATTFSDSYEAVGGAAVTVITAAENAEHYSCDSTTDAENGTLHFSCWAAGEYIITAAKGNTISRPYCKITVTGTGAAVSAYSQAADTALSALSLTFPGPLATSGLAYVGTEGMTVNNAVDSVILSAAVSDTTTPAAVSIAYQAAGAGAAAAYTPGDSAALAAGDNTFKLTVTNGTDTQIHTLVITRAAAVSRDISSEAAAVINGVKTVKGYPPYSDWILAMHAAGLAPDSTQLSTYLSAILSSVNNFADSGSGSVGTMAKHAIALTALGIDARQIPDPDGGAAIDLVSKITSYTGAVDPVYAAPYLLSLYDLGNYSVPAGAARTRVNLIDAILAAESNWSAWGFDGVGIILPALAPYYNAAGPVNGIEVTKCQEITQAIERALASLSAAQAIDGGLGSRNSNTTATVITGLNAIGVNAHTDTRFVKSGSSLVTDLLSFRTPEDKLGYTSSASASDMSCYQGFQALATWQNLTSGTRNQNLYHFAEEIAPYTAWPGARLLTGIAVTAQPATTTYTYSETETAAVPAAEGLEITATYNADALNKEIIPVASCTLSAIDRSSPGTQTVTVTYQDKTDTFMVAVLNSDSTVPVQKTVTVTVRSSSGTIAGDTVVIQEGTTSALDVLKTVLNRAGKTYVIRNGTYVAEIDGLGEFDRGPNSGWLYAVNGATPQSIPAGSCLLSDGSAVVWYYTLDYTSDESSSAWNNEQTDTGAVAPVATVSNGTASAAVTAAQLSEAAKAASKSGAAAVTVTPEIVGGVSGVGITLPTAVVREMVRERDIGVILDTPAGAVELGSAALASIARQAGGSEIEITVESKTPSDVNLPGQDLENSIIVAVSIASDGRNITRFDGNTLKLALPVPDGYAEGESYKVIVISADGSTETFWGKVTVTDGRAAVAVTVTHLSTFIVSTVIAGVFDDVAQGAWYADAVKYAVITGLFEGTGDNRFSPDGEMTRAMLAAVLYRLAGSPAATAQNIFSDVEKGTWYAGAVAWGAQEGIVRGAGDGLYGANAPVTRQEMAVMLCRYARYRGCDMDKTADLAAYGDAAGIPDWALGAMKWANAEGLVTGVTATALKPGGNTSRAMAAVILMRFMETIAAQ